MRARRPIHGALEVLEPAQWRATFFLIGPLRATASETLISDIAQRGTSLETTL